MIKILLACVMISIGLTSQAQPVVEIVVGAPPGGILDLNARQLRQQLAEIDPSRPYIVVNKPGAGGMIAYDYAARNNKPSLVMISVGGFTELLSRKSLDQIQQEVQLLPPIWRSPGVLGVSIRSGINNLDEFVEKGRSQKMTCGAAATSIAVALEYYVKEMKFKDTEVVRFKGTSDGIIQMHSGDLDCWLDAWHGPVAQAAINGQIRLIASSQDESHSATTGLPRMKRHLDKHSNFYYSWWGTVAIPNTTDAAFRKDIMPILAKAARSLESSIVSDVVGSDPVSPSFFIDQARMISGMTSSIKNTQTTVKQQ